MASRTCPYCNTTYLANPELADETTVSFQNSSHYSLHIFEFKCPTCDKVNVFLISGSDWDSSFAFHYPPATAMHLPVYIPEAIRQDYLEAIQIADLSPKASATLARRCLQGMIHDFWGIKEKNLNAEITSLRGKIPSKQWEAIDALRKIGNIGAHMENDTQLIVDVEPDEAKKLLKVIELLFKNWYIADHEDNQLLDEVREMAEEKESVRSPGSDKADGK